MSQELGYFIFLIERYAQAKGKTGAQVLEALDAAGLTEFVIGMYDLYHVERTENAFADIDDLLANGIPSP
ncbi:MAG: DUF3791 domain-containing protein [Bifidobacteriaceae bacterium]|jgi:hypothetical protein|nr:DUF3791 domain-containing protein [Bifidobacteriaceae bacterium]